MVSQARGKIITKINRIMQNYREQGATEVGNGVLGRLLEEESLPDEAVADFIINLLFAGNETTAKTMLFAVYFLTHCPRAMKQLVVLIHNFTIPDRLTVFAAIMRAYCNLIFLNNTKQVMIIYAYFVEALLVIYFL